MNTSKQSQMTEEQRKAMFARLRGGGGGTQRQSVYTQEAPTSGWGIAWEAIKGMGSGAAEGFANVLNALSFGATDSIGLTHTYEQEGWAADASKALAEIGSGAMYMAAGEIGMNPWNAGKLWKSGRLVPYFTQLDVIGAALKFLGGHQAESAIDNFREEHDLGPYWDMGLGVLSTASEYMSMSGAGRLMTHADMALTYSSLSRQIGGFLKKGGTKIGAQLAKKAPKLTAALKKAQKTLKDFLGTVEDTSEVPDWLVFRSHKIIEKLPKQLAVGKITGDAFNLGRGKKQQRTEEAP